MDIIELLRQNQKLILEYYKQTKSIKLALELTYEDIKNKIK